MPIHFPTRSVPSKSRYRGIPRSAWETTSGGVSTAAAMAMAMMIQDLRRDRVRVLTNPVPMRKSRNTGSRKTQPAATMRVKRKER